MTVNLSDLCSFSIASAAEAPRKQVVHVGESRSSIFALLATRSNSVANVCEFVRVMSGGCPFGVTVDQRKYQTIPDATAKPRTHVNRLAFIVCDSRLTSKQIRDHLRKQDHYDHDNKCRPEQH